MITCSHLSHGIIIVIILIVLIIININLIIPIVLNIINVVPQIPSSSDRGVAATALAATALVLRSNHGPGLRTTACASPLVFLGVHLAGN